MTLNAPTAEPQAGLVVQRYASENVTIANGTVTTSVYPARDVTSHRFTYHNKTALSCTVQAQYSPDYWQISGGAGAEWVNLGSAVVVAAGDKQPVVLTEEVEALRWRVTSTGTDPLPLVIHVESRRGAT